MNKALLLVVIISVSLTIALAQEPSRPEQGVDPNQPVDPGFAYPNAPDTMDRGTVLVRSLSGRAVDEQGIVLLHHQLRFLFPQSYNIRPESAVASRPWRYGCKH